MYINAACLYVFFFFLFTSVLVAKLITRYITITRFNLFDSPLYILYDFSNLCIILYVRLDYLRLMKIIRLE